MGKCVWHVCVVLLTLASIAFAQTERGNITGSVTDPSGAAVAGANVIVINTATNTSTNVQTTATGAYNVPNLQPGVYRVEVSAPGFKRFVQEKAVLTAAGTVRVSPQLSIGAVTETVEIIASVAQVQTENAKTTTTVQNRLVDELPLVVGGSMRSVYNLVITSPEGRGGGETFSLGGGQARAYDVTLDGVSVGTNRSSYMSEIGYNSPSLEAITEFTVDTNGFKAEYGHAGGGLVTFVSKSGTNQVHGSAYDFLRNDKFDARAFFERTKSVYRQNDFGATFGGPVYLPKLYNGRDRTFFFLSYEGFRNRQGANYNYATIPTPEMYEGDFSRWVNASGNLLPIYDPATTRPSGTGFVRDPFPNNRLPKDRFSAFARTLIPYGSKVRPNAPGIERGGTYWIQSNFLTSTGSTMEPQDKGGLKLDHSIGRSHRLGYFMNITRYRNELGPGGPPGLPLPLWSGQTGKFDSNVYRFSHDWMLSPAVLNHFVVGGNLFYKLVGSPNVTNNWKEQGVCLKGVIDCNMNFPQVGFSEFSSWGGSNLNGTEQPLWSIQEDLSWIRGSHAFKFGYAYQSQRAYGIAYQTVSGSVSFNRLGTSVPGQTTFNSGSSFASFLLGTVHSAATQTINVFRELYPYHGFYVQDDWRLSRRLVLNVGVRYEFTLPPVELDNFYSDFTPDRPNPAVNGYPGALRFAGSGPGRENKRALVPGWYGAIGPRIGLAYSMNPKTTVRTAFGRSFSKVTTPHGYGNFAGFAGTYSWASSDQGITPVFHVDDGFPPYQRPPLIDPAFANNQNVDYFHGQQQTRAPENLYWTFSIQRQVSSDTVLEASYNANVGTHLRSAVLNFNQTPTRYLNEFIQKYGATQALNLLRADINSPVARQAGIPIPYPNFTDPKVQTNRTVNQALRPFPQYLTVNTSSRNGDKSGHSSYHALVIKVERRYSGGLTFQWNYTLSKVLGDSDDFATTSGVLSQDHYNRRLEKSIGQYDQTHALKLSTIYELPFGRRRRWMSSSRLADTILGGWRVAAIQTYLSGVPVAISRDNPFPIFNGVTRPVIDSYENWRASIKGEKFDPAVDLFMNLSAFPPQPNDRFGNSTRRNPNLRTLPELNENISIAKTFPFRESMRLDFRWEAFNFFNRVRFGTGSTNLNALTFGRVTSQSNTARQMQMGLKLYW